MLVKTIFTFLILLMGSATYAQTWQNADTVTCPKEVKNIYVHPLYSDSLSSSFVIFIKKEVKKHKHQYHSEHVIVLEGEGKMTLGAKEFVVKKGDVIFIPKGVPHKVTTTSKKPLKVISVQAPKFLGKDRIMIE